MNWSNWRTWAVASAAVIVLFVIISFAATKDTAPDIVTTPPPGAAQPAATPRQGAKQPKMTIGSVEPIRDDLLEKQSGEFRSRRNLFAFVEPPPPPPPAPPPPPPDRDKDGVPDFMDNCPQVKNPDQADLDRDGIGASCETEPEIIPPPPPPPPPVPPPFDFKYLGTFGTPSRPLATFARGDEIINVRVGQTFGGGKFILRSIGLESVEIGFVGFPPDVKNRVPIGR